MRTTVLLSALTISLSSASLLAPRQYTSDSESSYDRVERLCFPTNSSNGYNLDAPCNKVFDVEARCVFGDEYDDVKNGAQEDVEGDIKHASPEKQRDCIC